MRLSRLGVFFLLTLTVFLTANCGYFNRILSRKNLVDGSQAYKDKKFPLALDYFRRAAARDPEGATLEGRTAQLFVARTLHSQFIGNRNPIFGEGDFLGESGLGLAGKIFAKGDPLSQYLHDRLTPATQQVYAEYNASNPELFDADGVKKKNELLKKFLSSFTKDLNAVLSGGQSIYDPARFAQVKLSEFTQQYMAQQPAAERLIRLNRLLLEDAYPDEIAKKPKAEEAVSAYQKALALNPNDQSSYKAIASLYENLEQPDDWQKLVTERANNTQIEPQYRAEALTALAIKQDACAKEISDTEKTKKTVKKDGKDVYQFVKPENPEDFEKLKRCVAEGTKLIEQSVSLEPEAVRTAKNLDVKTLSDEDLKKYNDLLSIFESARSYKRSLAAHAMRLAEMDGREADREKLKADFDRENAQFNELRDVNRNFKAEIDRRIQEKKEAENANANANANANKK